MNIRSTSNTVTFGTNTRRHPGRAAIVTIVGGVLILSSAVFATAAYRGERSDSHPALAAAPAPTAATTPFASAVPVQGPHTLYIVGSQAEADAIMAAIKDANAIRDTIGEPPVVAAVVVVGSRDEADRLVPGQPNLNGILDTNNEPGMEIVDLYR